MIPRSWIRIRISHYLNEILIDRIINKKPAFRIHSGFTLEASKHSHHKLFMNIHNVFVSMHNQDLIKWNECPR